MSVWLSGMFSGPRTILAFTENPPLCASPRVSATLCFILFV